MVKIETGSRISVQRTVVFLNRKYLYLSCGLLRYVDEILFADRGQWCSQRGDLGGLNLPPFASKPFFFTAVKLLLLNTITSL